MAVVNVSWDDVLATGEEPFAGVVEATCGAVTHEPVLSHVVPPSLHAVPVGAAGYEARPPTHV